MLAAGAGVALSFTAQAAAQGAPQQNPAIPPWSARYGHTNVVFNSKLWIIGGKEGAGASRNDVWSSPDGVTWTQVIPTAPWSQRFLHRSVAFHNKLWVIGGDEGDGDFRQDVWSSPDGVTWTQVNIGSYPLWTKRSGHTSVVFDHRLWVMGGWDENCDDSVDFHRNDVWSSSDGVKWSQLTSDAHWCGRGGHSSAVFDNKLWVIAGEDGGDSVNDVWSSPDGVTWTQVNRGTYPPWIARYGHTSVVFDNKLWVIGGRAGSNAGESLNDVWSSPDGIKWTEVTAAAPWPGRMGHTSVVFDNKLWVIGGSAGSSAGSLNDVWCSPDGATWTQVSGVAP
jgi:hypothetical protein